MIEMMHYLSPDLGKYEDIKVSSDSDLNIFTLKLLVT